MSQQVVRGMFGAVAAAAVALSSALDADAGARHHRLRTDTTRTPTPLRSHRPPRPAASTSNVGYYGGRVISNVKVVEVFWTTQVDAPLQAQIGAFYTAIVQSSFVDWMTEYDTIGKMGMDGQPGSNQHIGRGTYKAAFTITPANTATTLQDTDISTELVAQIQSGALPKPTTDAAGNVNTIYMIDFPSGYAMSDGGGNSCTDFDAFHNSIAIGGVDVPYGVHADCGDPFETKTLVHSHELAEAMTDMEVGAVTGTALARPFGWISSDTNQDEVGDLCENDPNAKAVVNGFTVQMIWSNFASACVAAIPICDGSATPPQCRPCNPYDNGNACSGGAPTCDTSTGQCVAGAPVVDAGGGAVDAGAGSSSGSSSGGEGSSSGSGSGSSSGGASSGSGSGGSVMPEAGAPGDGDAGAGSADGLSGGSSGGCRIGHGKEPDTRALVGGLLLLAALGLRRNRV